MERFVEEVLRINERYLVEVVEAFNLCPFARAARLGGAVDRQVLLNAEADMESALAAIRKIEGDLQIVIGLLIFPRLQLDPAGFDRMLGDIRRADEAQRKPPFAMAGFHPQAGYAADSPAKLVP